jgi:hypothetical protein
VTFFFNLDKREKECRVLNQGPLSLPLCLLLLLLWKEVKEAKISSCSYRRGRRAQTRAESF